MKFLIVDDSKTMLRIVSNVVKQIGYDNSILAENGQEGLEAFKSNDCDIILTDWNMPVMDGLTFIKEVRKLNKDIPIIMITTEGGKTEVIKALKAGVNSYIIKPFDSKTLELKLRDLL